MTDKLKNKISQIPELPGIYKMLDSKGNILYIGKSKCLKKRVKSYFVKNPKWDKVKRLVFLIDDIEYIVTDTHLEARLLECELIKSIKPYFNSQMKNHERYVYLKVMDFNKYKSLKVLYEREDNCFGPFRKKFTLSEIIDSFKNLYPIIKNNNGYDFEYHLFPISMDKDIFNINKINLLDLLSNNKSLDSFIVSLYDKMKEAASLCKFETAKIYREMIQNFSYVKIGINRYNDLLSKNILLRIPVDNGYKLFFVSNGQILLKQKYTVETQINVEYFIQKAMDLASTVSFDIDEKSHVDFKDIIYSEIIDLPQEMVVILN